jgi:ATP/maltotriose-dependent transcriptional regulator MalT
LASLTTWFWSSRGHYLEARQWLDAFLAVSTSRPVRGRGLIEFANILHWLGDLERAAQSARESIVMLQDDDPYLTMCAWRRLGSIAIDQGEFPDARRYLAECDALIATAGGSWEQDWADWDKAFAIFLAGKLAAAASLSAEALDRFQAANTAFSRIGDHGYAATALGRMGSEWIKQGNANQARQALMSSLELAIELEDRASIAWALLGAACLASNDGDSASATLLLDVGTGLREAVGELRTPISGFGHPLLLKAELQQANDARQRTMANERDVALAIDLARSVLSAQPTLDDRVSTSGRSSPLTAREHEVLALLAEGMGDKAIAVMLGMSRRTASKHVATILEKLEAESRTGAVTRAMRQGLLAAPSAAAQ